ncbi:MAG: SDR family oxidoreductase [Bacilli bacterium]|nr:SDR family oxidoreductase [Bacilli bacterium]
MKALITGGSSGIGLAIAKELANKGIDLVLVARDEKKLKEISEDIKSVNVDYYVCDVSDIKSLEKLYNDNKDIDILVNNAGFGLFGLFNETDLDKELNMIDVNIKAVHILTKLYLKDFIKKDKGYILNVASSAGFLAGPNLSTYYATKNYVCRLDEAIYQELKEMKSNVHISSLCPGPVETNFNKVAGGTFATKGVDATTVAKEAVKGMFKGKMIIVPTFIMKLGVFFSRIAPRKFLLKYIYNYQSKKMSK